MLTEHDLDAIAARAEAATAGEWEQRRHGGDNWTHAVYAGNWAIAKVARGKAGEDERDAAFIAHARQDVPALVAALREARRVLKSVEWVRQETDYGTRGLCPCCDRFQPGSLGWSGKPLEEDRTGHAPACALKAALGER